MSSNNGSQLCLKTSGMIQTNRLWRTLRHDDGLDGRSAAAHVADPGIRRSWVFNDLGKCGLSTVDN